MTITYEYKFTFERVNVVTWIEEHFKNAVDVRAAIAAVARLLYDKASTDDCYDVQYDGTSCFDVYVAADAFDLKEKYDSEEGRVRVVDVRYADGADKVSFDAMDEAGINADNAEADLEYIGGDYFRGAGKTFAWVVDEEKFSAWLNARLADPATCAK